MHHQSSSGHMTQLTLQYHLDIREKQINNLISIPCVLDRVRVVSEFVLE